MAKGSQWSGLYWKITLGAGLLCLLSFSSVQAAVSLAQGGSFNVSPNGAAERMTPAFATFAALSVINGFARKPQELLRTKRVGKFDDSQMEALVKHAQSVLATDAEYQKVHIRKLCDRTLTRKAS